MRWLPRKTFDRLFVALLVWNVAVSLIGHEWWTATGWAVASSGWYIAIIEGDDRRAREGVKR